MAAKSILFIEGEPNSPNGDLRQGLSKLLEQKLKGKLPRMILGAGKKQTIDKFKNNKLDAQFFLLLVDLDATEDKIQADLNEHQLSENAENVFYMVQEMENWFLSQPDILDKFYGKDTATGKLMSKKLPNKKAIDIDHPDEVLQNLTKNTKKGEYHKIKHAVELLKLLDANKLEADFTEFKRLIKRLK
jgi:Domain of unknown function (DUF4276)